MLMSNNTSDYLILLSSKKGQSTWKLGDYMVQTWNYEIFQEMLENSSKLIGMLVYYWTQATE